MIIFVSGVHGSGKSFLCNKYATGKNLTHASASELIKQELSSPNWSNEKKVKSPNENQNILARALGRISTLQKTIILDGHFTLIDANNGIIKIETSSFAQLNIHHAILIQTTPEVISERLAARDNSISPVDLAEFISTEQSHAKFVCEQLSIPLSILTSPSIEQFTASLDHIIGSPI